MLTTSLRRLTFGALSLALAAIPALAQTASPNIGVTQSKTSGSWMVRCYTVPQLPCDMTQMAYVRGGNMRVASIAITYAPTSNAYVARFVVPLGVSFESGLAIQIGDFKAAHLRYRRCERDGCYVEGVLPQTMIDALNRGGGNGAMNVVFIDGRKISIPIALNGASESLDQLKSWASDKAASGKASKK